MQWHKIDPGTNIPNSAARSNWLHVNRRVAGRRVPDDRPRHSGRPSFCENPPGYCNPGPNRCPRNPCWSQSWRSSDYIGSATAGTAIIPAWPNGEWLARWASWTLSWSPETHDIIDFTAVPSAASTLILTLFDVCTSRYLARDISAYSRNRKRCVETVTVFIRPGGKIKTEVSLHVMYFYTQRQIFYSFKRKNGKKFCHKGIE